MELIPIRGQLAILIPQPEVRYAFTGEAGYMFPRPDGIVIGGTYERNIWEAEPQPERIARIDAAHQRLFAGFRCPRSEEHTSELQSLMRLSYAVFCLKNIKNLLAYSTHLHQTAYQC